ncbi:MAG TPA: ABC transporter permease [Bacteroidia bacterium]|nr:ABC transporter permease [Bacteroidia bacterium]
MSTISLIIKREYLTRVRKKSFIIMTILGPILMASIFIVPILMAKFDETEVTKIQVIDESGLFKDKLTDSEDMSFVMDTISLPVAKTIFSPEKFTAILYIPANVITNTNSVMLFSAKQANLGMVTSIERTIQKEIETLKLKGHGINQETLDQIKTKVRINTRKLTEAGEEESSAGLTTAVGMIAGLLIYMFIFLYGAQVMRGVIEEKTSRIVEVIISSVRPFQLMMGKIIGIALVGLTQFLLWIILTVGISSVVTSMFVDKDQQKEQMAHRQSPLGTPLPEGVEGGATQMQDNEMSELMNSMNSINFPLLLGAFLFYFLGGYLLYGALFAAIGAAVDGESDTQQFMLPITIPLILSFIVAQSILQNPESKVGFWFSMIPFTSPVVMMVRIPFGVAPWELILSMGLLVVGFIVTTWLAGRIYRTGILMYGKKVSYKELGKWLFYKE